MSNLGGLYSGGAYIYTEGLIFGILRYYISSLFQNLVPPHSYFHEATRSIATPLERMLVHCR